ncbi:MAG: hypothetical protein R3C68_11715 [Myxococcota bacterium]
MSYSSHVFTAAADALIDISDKEHRRTTYHVGTEYFAVNELPLRLGYRSAYVVDSKSGALERDNIVSAGIGWVNKAGGFEATYTQSIDRSDNWSAIGAVKFYL